jgi:hypothetical protein
MLPTLRKSAKDGAPGFVGGLRVGWTSFVASHPSQKREGWGTRLCWRVESGLDELCGFPPLRRKKGARMGQPPCWRVESGLVELCGFPPFAKARRMGHPLCWRVESGLVELCGFPPFAKARRMGHPLCWRVESGLVELCGFLPLRRKKGARMGQPLRSWIILLWRG